MFTGEGAGIVDSMLRATLAAAGGDVGLILHQHPADCGCGFDGQVGLVLVAHRPGMSAEGVAHLIGAAGKMFDS